MKGKRLFGLLLALVLCVGVIPLTANAASIAWDGRKSEPFAGGDGSKDAPYQIANGAQLYYLTLQESTDYYYELTSDIDLNNKLFPMILKFEGTLNGKGFEISGLNVNLTNSNSVKAAGLIGHLTGNISNLTVSASVKSALDIINAGGIAGKMTLGTIENCTNYCTVELTSTSSTNAGGIVGYISNGKVYNCRNYGSVSGYSAGGIIGKVVYGVSDVYTPASVAIGCVNTGNVTGVSASATARAGGICGSLQGRKVEQCCNLGNITADGFAGGIIGNGNGTKTGGNYYFTELTNCYNTGSVSSAKTSGGIAGSFGRFSSNSYIYSKINCCYNVGTLSSNSTSSGDIFGTTSFSSSVSLAKYSNCFYLVGNNESTTNSTGTARNDDELQGVGAYSNFDFKSIWGWDNSGKYPYAILQRIGLPENVCKHSLVAVPEQKATCTEDGYRAHYKCSTCNKLFTDVKGEHETTLDELKISAGHSFTNYKSNNDATCTADGTKTAKCDTVGCTATDTVTDVGSKKNHSYTKNTASSSKASAATCTEPEKYYAQCDNCDHVSKTLTVAVGDANGHRTTHHDAVDPTYDAGGNVEYWYCSVCEKYFSDKNCTKELDDVSLPPRAPDVTVSLSEDGTLTVSGALSEHAETTNTVFLAVYQDGRMLCVKDISSLTQNAFQFVCGNMRGADTVKIFRLGGGMSPQFSAFSIKIA